MNLTDDQRRQISIWNSLYRRAYDADIVGFGHDVPADDVKTEFEALLRRRQRGKFEIVCLMQPDFMREPEFLKNSDFGYSWIIPQTDKRYDRDRLSVYFY